MLLHDNGAAEHIGGCGRQAQKQAKKNGMHLRRMISVPSFEFSIGPQPPRKLGGP